VAAEAAAAPLVSAIADAAVTAAKASLRTLPFSILLSLWLSVSDLVIC
jgi:hypothetical protein